MPRSVGFLFFSSRRRHTRYWRDWSSDVCSSDLSPAGAPRGRARPLRSGPSAPPPVAQRERTSRDGDDGAQRRAGDLKSVVEGKSVDLGGGRIIQEKNDLVYLRDLDLYLHRVYYV